MSTIKADRFTALKAKVKAECLRRSYSGSVADYGGAAYDYTETPAAGKTVRQEHRDKLSGPLRAINPDGIAQHTGSGAVSETELAAMETKVTAWAARSITDTSGSDCKSGCTGACYTGCVTGCSGCSGCSGGCSGGCRGCGSGCPSGCSGCGSGCPSGCSGCGSGCPSGCSGTCDTGCDSTCGRVCSSGCPNGCSGGCKTSTSPLYV